MEPSSLVMAGRVTDQAALAASLEEYWVEVQ